jgi:hypothetical protein
MKRCPKCQTQHGNRKKKCECGHTFVDGDPGKYKHVIIRDTREKSGHGWFWEPDAYYDGTVVQKVDTGDYTLRGYEKIFSIDRKGCVSEWANNLISDAFYREMERSKSLKHFWILLEFNMHDLLVFPKWSGIPKRQQKYMKMTGPVILAKTLNLNVSYPQVQVIFCGKVHGKQVARSIFKRMIDKYGNSTK